MSTKSSKRSENRARLVAQAKAVRARDAALHTRPPSVFATVMADMAAVRGITFPPGHCWPPAADGAPPWPIVVNEAGEWSQVEPDR